MITNLAPQSTARRVSLVSADGAAWRIKPEVRTLANIIKERQIATEFFKWREANSAGFTVRRTHTLALWLASKLSNPFGSKQS